MYSYQQFTGALQNMRTKIHAHRGASAYRPENTLEAFALAVEQGADCIELDVHLSRDGQIVVAHDERLERVSDGSGFIHEHTLDELKALNFNKLFPDQPACRIPTLAEVYELIENKRVSLNIELKTTEQLYPELPEKLVQMERDFSMTGRCLYSSFNHYSLQEIKRINPKAPIGLLYELGMVDPWVYAEYLSATAIHPHYFVIMALPRTVQRCHQHDIQVNVWTVDNPVIINRMINCNVDAIITNKPDIAIACRDNLT